MRSILLKIIESPRDTATNRLFLRLADELPLPALKLLNATHGTINSPTENTKQGIGKHADLQDYDMNQVPRRSGAPRRGPTQPQAARDL